MTVQKKQIRISLLISRTCFARSHRCRPYWEIGLVLYYIGVWIQLGRTRIWWDNFLEGVILAEGWKENFRMGKDNFYKLCGELYQDRSSKGNEWREDIDSLLVPRSN